ncbi:MAG: DUF917 domain-containing protein [Spirochaetaceae bacterium]|jgi:DUF917 family protein|nr:DUF917 domain-containing protein [Spirochaetaceae bacterium]
MRKIDVSNLEDITIGASLLGSGGGGDPYIGKLLAIEAIQDCGPVSLLDPDEVPDDMFIAPFAVMGAPSVLTEKAVGGNEYKTLYDTINTFFGKKIDAIMPLEAGGVNSMFPIAAAARLGLPLIDADGMGRAFPELQMLTFTIGGVNATPMALADEKGNSVLFNTITNKWTEDLARAVTMTCGGSAPIALYCMDGKTLKQYGIKRIVSRSQTLGQAIREIKHGAGTPEENFLKVSGGYKLFRGKITDVLREVRGAFNFGKAILDGLGEYKGQHALIEFQNENLVASVEGEIKATTPDLICLVDTETFIPIPTDAFKYGKRVLVVGLACFKLWRSPKGIELTGPRYFGYDSDYIPIEIRAQGGS